MGGDLLRAADDVASILETARCPRAGCRQVINGPCDWCNDAYVTLLRYRKARATAGWQPLETSAPEENQTERQAAEIERLLADSARLDWLDRHCTRVADSERYLPRSVYWGEGANRDVRGAIDAAMNTSTEAKRQQRS